MNFSKILLSISFWCFSTQTVLQAVPVVINQLVAIVGSEVITTLDLKNLTRGTLAPGTKPADGAAAGSAPQGEPALLKKQALESKIETLLVKNEAVRLGIEAKDKDIDFTIGDILAKNRIDLPTLTRLLEEQRKPYSEYREEIAFQIEKYKVINKVIRSKAEVTELDIKNAYEKEYGSKNLKELVSFQSLFIPTKKPAEAKHSSNVSEIEEAIRAGTAFDELVLRYSDEAERKTTKGLHREIPLESLAPELKKALVKMTIDQVVGPLVSANAIYFVKLLARTTVLATEISQVRQQLSQQLLEKELENQYREWLKDAKNQTFIDIRDPLLRDS
jgi:parvulin-like peptidyl-prolyl isomerase